MGIRQGVKAGLGVMRGQIGLPARALWNRALAATPLAPTFIGAYPDPATALASLPARTPGGYDHDAVAEVSFDRMCQLQLWDYPVLFWLDRLQRPGLRVLDMGGHMGTKYIAFGPFLPLADWDWCVCDLPAIIRAARARQDRGALPAAIRFVTHPDATRTPDLLLASGVMQYIDASLGDLIGRLPGPPRHIVLNKVATREGAAVTTLERIGPARVPYQMRNRLALEAEIAALGYRILDRWDIPSLSHVIPTHPALGPSRSLGYCLERLD